MADSGGRIESEPTLYWIFNRAPLVSSFRSSRETITWQFLYVVFLLLFFFSALMLKIDIMINSSLFLSRPTRLTPTRKRFSSVCVSDPRVLQWRVTASSWFEFEINASNAWLRLSSTQFGSIRERSVTVRVTRECVSWGALGLACGEGEVRGPRPASQTAMRARSVTAHLALLVLAHLPPPGELQFSSIIRLHTSSGMALTGPENAGTSFYLRNYIFLSLLLSYTSGYFSAIPFHVYSICAGSSR